ncbi:MAG: hemerythrin domain-containing protein [Myxococcales bacterium]|nr:hemerythrin domain-containing protein [Myxococcales bacterium]
MKEKLLEAHREMEAILRGVASSIRDEETSSMSDDFDLFERKLLQHLDWEEMHILPAYERIDPAGASELLAEHQRFRRTLGAIGLEIDLHIVRAERFDTFASELHAHAQHEDRMYAMLDELHGEGEREALRRRHGRFHS